MARRLITRDDVAQVRPGTIIRVDRHTLITPSARDLAAERGVRVVQDGLGPEPVVGVPGPAGAVLEAPAGVAAAPSAAFEPDGPSPSPEAPRAATEGRGGDTGVVLSVVGRDRPRVLAEITAAVAQRGANILDITQRLVGNYFTTVMVIDIRDAAGTFGDFKRALEGLSREGDYRITVQHEKVFRYMHRI